MKNLMLLVFKPSYRLLAACNYWISDLTATVTNSVNVGCIRPRAGANLYNW